MRAPTLMSVTILKEDNLEVVKMFLGAQSYVTKLGLSQPATFLGASFSGSTGYEYIAKGTELRKYSNRTITAVENGSERYLKFSAK